MKLLKKLRQRSMSSSKPKIRVDVGKLRLKVNPQSDLITNIYNSLIYNMSGAQQDELNENINKHFYENPEALAKLKITEASVLQEPNKKSKLDTFLKNNGKLLIAYGAYKVSMTKHYCVFEHFEEAIHEFLREKLPKVKGYSTKGNITFSAITTQKNVNKFCRELETEGIICRNPSKQTSAFSHEVKKGVASNWPYDIDEKVLLDKYELSLAQLDKVYEKVIIPFYNETSEQFFNLIKKLGTHRRDQLYEFDTGLADTKKILLFLDYTPQLVELLTT